MEKIEIIQAEKNILGALMIDNSLIYNDSYKLLTDKHFSAVNSVVFKAIQEVSTGKIDMISVLKSLRSSNMVNYIGGASYISELASNSCLSHEFDTRCYFIHENFIKSNLSDLGIKIQSIALNEAVDTFDKVDNTLNLVREFNEGIEIKKKKSKDEVIEDLVIDIETRAKTGFTGLQTCIREIDEKIGGLGKGDLIIIAGRPAMGKTSLALSIAYRMSKGGKKGLFFSLEMKKESIYTKLFAIDGKIATKNLFRGTLSAHEEQQLYVSSKNIREIELEVIDESFSLSKIISDCYSQKQMVGLDYVIVDYLQLMEVQGKGNREQEVSHISRQLKMLAMKLDIPVIALSQLSRSVEGRADKKPQLSDLRESGSIEQDASIVAFCYRPAYYELTNEDGVVEHDTAYVILGKNRNGVTGGIKLNYDYQISQDWGCDLVQETVNFDFSNNFKPNTDF
jgi:replicative DNA helicase